MELHSRALSGPHARKLSSFWSVRRGWTESMTTEAGIKKHQVYMLYQTSINLGASPL